MWILRLNNSFLLAIVTGCFISCSPGQDHKNDIQKPESKADSIALTKAKWEKEKQEKTDLNKRIKIPKHWQSNKNPNKSIWITISTDFNTYLLFENKDFRYFTIKEMKETEDSLIFVTTFSKGKIDSTVNWSFKYIDTIKKTAQWNFFNVQSGKFINTGIYTTVKD